MSELQAEKVARILKVPVANVKKLFSRNAEQLLVMANKAAKTGKNVNNYTEQELRSTAQNFEDFAEGRK